MVSILSHAFDDRRPAEPVIEAPTRLIVTPDTAAHHFKPTIDKPTELDLRGPDGFAELRRSSLIWPALPASERRAWVNGRELVLPPRSIRDNEITLLPGGAVALRGPDALLVCDPIETAVCNQAEMKHLRRVLRTRPDVSTLSHTSGGVVVSQRLPKNLPPQTVTIVPNAARLPIRVGFGGPALIQWGLHGAVVRPLVAAPALLAPMVSIAASARVGAAPGLVHRGPTFQDDTWQAVDEADRWRLITAPLMEHVSDLVAGTACDDLRLALLDHCVNGVDSLARRIARALAVLPACFAADPAALPGAPPPIWRQAMAHVIDSMHPRALLGLDNLADPLAATRALRGVLGHAEVMTISEDGEPQPGCAVPLHGDAALFLARQAGAHGRLAVAIPTPVAPVDLYTLASDIAHLTGGRVVAAAPCWGFCHRVGPDGDEAGNAGWFGMGVGLDEVDFLADDSEFGR